MHISGGLLNWSYAIEVAWTAGYSLHIFQPPSLAEIIQLIA